MTTPASTTAPIADRGDRIGFAVIAGMTGFLGLVNLADGIWRTVALAFGSGPVDLIAGGDLPGNVGRISGATVVSSDIADDARLLIVIASALSVVIWAAIYGAIVTFLVMTARGTPFHRRLYPVLLTTGMLMALGGLLAAGLDGLGRMMAGGGLGEPYETAFELHLGPWAFGFVVLVAAFVIRAGQRLQHDTEGLV